MSSNPQENRLKEQAKYSGDPWVPANPYFAHAEKHMQSSWDKLIWPTIKDCRFDVVIDLAAGHGRNSEKLLPLSGKLIVMDIQAGNIEACRKRFEGRPNVEFIVNNGYDLRPVPDNSVTLVYCFDAMVHFEPDVVKQYQADIARVLVKGGRAFLHHSNYTGGTDWRKNPASRNYMSQELFYQGALAAGLRMVSSKVINWDGHVNLDCLSVMEKP